MTDPSDTPPASDIAPVTIEDEMRRSYLDYAMSVIVSRALPDVRDGLKPVHRRILYAMNENGYVYNRPFRKSARIVGDVMGQYHPHGDSAIYDAMVRMAQDFSMRLKLIDGQGNFGSMDGDKAAAMRYTEARLSKAAHALLEDIDKDTVDFQPNYDENSVEPVVLPARFPNLLVNGAGGIAVGMATNLPPHNLGEVIDATLALIDDPELSAEDLLEIVPGPDFPTGALVMGKAGIRAAYLTGRGSIVMRARCTIEPMARDREAIVVTEVPYQVNKAAMIERMAEMVRDKKLEGISDIRDESDRRGVRVVIEVKRDAVADVVLNQLYRFTALQTSFGVNMLALDQGRPRMLTLMDILKAFIAFREEVIRRRTIHELGKARDRAHVLVGLAVAVVNVDRVVAMIRGAPDPQTARERLMAEAWPVGEVAPMIALIDEPGRGVEDGCYRLSETQARAILDLRLHRLTGLEREKIQEELREIGARIEEYLAILGSREKLFAVMRGELAEVREAFATPRRTELQDVEFEVDDESLIAREDMVVTVTNTGYIKRVPLSTYRAQRRGGKGRAGMAMRDEDFVTSVFVASTHTPLLFFSSAGIVYKLKVHRLPQGTPQARGKAMVNLLPLGEGETISTIMDLPEDEDTWGELDVMFATASGSVRRNKLSDFTNIMANGKIAMKLEPGDSLIAVRTCSETDDVLLATHAGKCIRFPVGEVRVFAGRTSTGVRGIRLGKGDRVISMGILHHVEHDPATRAAFLKRANQLRRRPDEEDGEADRAPDVEAEAVEPGALSDDDYERMAEGEEFVLTVTENGFGKRTSSYEYRITGRGGQGIINIDTAARNGNVVASFPVAADDQIMLITNAGKLIRMPLNDVRIAGRKTLGVRLFRTADDEVVVSAAHLPASLADGDNDENDGDHGGAEDGDVGSEP
ncbi:DNA gyrase subunit A [Rhodospira trueperi]|uniref:DNA gyrase subunit A n=1 Tax=Rhodospira trueperi TaxID=69960 RepID=A0A1G7DSH5_9PROT|nr:DNA gyrase subunit A [Rhodospira trueperi]SDE54438.1 DNA gyrase subunit A [Rhodospira trueperi]